MNNKNLPYQTLHAHTTVSDGHFGYLEVLRLAEQNRIGTIAFTDHDSVPSASVVQKLNKYSGDVDWIFGIEISSGPSEKTEVKTSQHVVGLFIDPFNKELRDHCKKAQEARIDRMEKTVKNLRGIGFDISADECLEASGGETITRPHIVKALKSKDVNLQRIEELRREMQKASENDSEVKKKFDEMMKRGEDQYPYVLFLSSDAFIPDVYVGYSYKTSMERSSELIRNAGGVAVLAHWFTYMHKVTEDTLDHYLANNVLDGFETVYGLDAISKDELTSQQKVLRKIIDRYGKLESGGADAHKLEHFVDFGKTEWYAMQTVGLAEKILQNSDADAKNSSMM